MNNQRIVVFDFETDSVDTELASPVEISAVVIEPFNLEILEDTWFHGFCRPPDIEEPDYFTKHQKTIEWHAKLHDCAIFDIIEKWKSYSSEKIVIESFVQYLKQQNFKSKYDSAPIAAGTNIREFDLKILQKKLTQYGFKNDVFWKRDVIDIKDFCFYWFESLPYDKKPFNYQMDTLREFFGMDADGAHTAKQDVRDEAQIIIRFLRAHRKFANLIGFKNAFKKQLV